MPDRPPIAPPEEDPNVTPIETASPPCFMHEVDPAYMGLSCRAGGAPDKPGAALRAPTTEAGAADPDWTRLGQVVIRDIPDAVVYADRDGIIRFWNAGATRIFGFDAAEAVGQSLDIIIPERLRARHWDGYGRMMATGTSRYGAGDLLSVPAVTKSGETLSIRFTVAAVPDGTGGIAGIVAVLRDVTATFQELKRLRAKG